MTDLPDRLLADMRRSRRLVVIMDVGTEQKSAFSMAHFGCDFVTALGVVDMTVAGVLNSKFRGSVPYLDVRKDDPPMFEVRKKEEGE